MEGGSYISDASRYGEISSLASEVEELPLAMEIKLQNRIFTQGPRAIETAKTYATTVISRMEPRGGPESTLMKSILTGMYDREPRKALSLNVVILALGLHLSRHLAKRGSFSEWKKMRAKRIPEVSVDDRDLIRYSMIWTDGNIPLSYY